MPDLSSRRWLTIAEAAEHIGVVPLTIRRRIADGSLRGYRMRGARRIVRIDRHELDALMQRIPTGDDRCVG